MRTVAEHQHAPHQGLRDQLAVVRRRKWWILGCIAVVPAVAVVLSLRQAAEYEASAQVLLNRQNLSNALTNTIDPTVQDPNRVTQTQARLARVYGIAQQVVAAAGLPGLTVKKFLDASSVSSASDADVLQFNVQSHSSPTAKRLANLYASDYIAFRLGVDTAPLQRARADVERHIRELGARGRGQSALGASLAEKDQQLRTMEALQTSNATIVQQADTATQVAPRPVRNGLIALLLGIIFGFGLAFLWEALDTRIRTSQELVERLGLNLLARIPEPPSRLQRADRLVTVAEPSSYEAEAFRVLRMNLAFANNELGAKTIMVTSAVPEEGKSTTVSNLAVSLARAGQRVALVDLDLRRPYIDRFFGFTGRRGLTDVALGDVPLNLALRRIVLGRDDRHDERNGNGNGNGNGQVEAVLHVLTAGHSPPAPGEFVGSSAVKAILDELAANMDVVLIDAPPMLTVGDAVTLSERVDAIIVIARTSVVRRPMVSELRRQLDSCPAEVLGFVLTQAESEEGYGTRYGGSYRYDYSRRYDPAAQGQPA